MKIRSSYELNEALNFAIAWRKKEISTLRLLIAVRKEEHERATLRRAAVPILYAHWEGFAKEAATVYLELVLRQRRKYSELRENFVALATRGRIRQARESRKLSTHLPIVEFLISGQEGRAKFPVSGAIETESNLSSTVLKDLLTTIGVSYDSNWIAKELIIDGSLLKTRNEVAHGESAEVDDHTYSQLHDLVLELLDLLRNEIENAAVMRRYLRS